MYFFEFEVQFTHTLGQNLAKIWKKISGNRQKICVLCCFLVYSAAITFDLSIIKAYKSTWIYLGMYIVHTNHKIYHSAMISTDLGDFGLMTHWNWTKSGKTFFLHYFWRFRQNIMKFSGNIHCHSSFFW